MAFRFRNGQFEDPKNETFWKILSNVIKLEVEKGPLRWKITDLARASGVQRTLIYYYFGNSKERILENSIQVMASEIFGLGRGALDSISNGTFTQALESLRKLLQDQPVIPAFYLMTRQSPCGLGEKIRLYEKQYIQRLQLTFPHLNASAVEAFFAVLVGLVTTPWISSEAVQLSLNSFSQTLNVPLV